MADWTGKFRVPGSSLVAAGHEHDHRGRGQRSLPVRPIRARCPRRRAAQGRRPHPVAGQPFELLAMLLQRPAEVLTRDELRRQLWPDGTFVDFEHGLNAAVKRLRAALGDNAERSEVRGDSAIAAATASSAPSSACAASSDRRRPRAVAGQRDRKAAPRRAAVHDALSGERRSRLLHRRACARR